VTVKYFQISAPNIVHLKPANNDLNDIEINLEETELYIEGKSVGLIREN
jgi:SOS-response transcriptional repressor LexA